MYWVAIWLNCLAQLTWSFQWGLRPFPFIIVSATVGCFRNINLVAWDYGHQDVSILRELKAQGGQWLMIPSWNSYTGESGQESLRTRYPTLYSGIVEFFLWWCANSPRA